MGRRRALSGTPPGTHLPTLTVWEARDPFIPVGHATVARKAIPGSRLEIFDGVGHHPHCEAPGRFVEVLFDFIASTKPAHLPPRPTQPGAGAERSQPTAPSGVEPRRLA